MHRYKHILMKYGVQINSLSMGRRGTAAKLFPHCQTDRSDREEKERQREREANGEGERGRGGKRREERKSEYFKRYKRY